MLVTVQLTVTVSPNTAADGAVAPVTTKSGAVKLIGKANTLFVSSVSP